MVTGFGDGAEITLHNGGPVAIGTGGGYLHGHAVFGLGLGKIQSFIELYVMYEIPVIKIACRVCDALPSMRR